MGKWLKIFTIITGCIMIVLGAALMFTNPQTAGVLSEGLRTPVLALEFMSGQEELIRFFDVYDVRQLKFQAWVGNQIDFFFMVFYSLFSVLTGWMMYKETRVKVLLLCLPFGVMMLTGDVLENVHIMTMLSIRPEQLKPLFFEQLRFFTWLKWGSIAAMMCLYAMYFLQGQWWKKIIGLLLLAAFGLSVAAFVMGGIYLEIMALSIFVGFIGLFVFSLFWKLTEDTAADATESLVSEAQ
jgi:hypothetical protein